MSSLEKSNLSSNSKTLSGKNLALSEKRVHVIFVLLDGSEIGKIQAEYLKKLSRLAPIIPVLSKGDLLDPTGVKLVKETTMRTARSCGVEFYDIKEVHYPKA